MHFVDQDEDSSSSEEDGETTDQEQQQNPIRSPFWSNSFRNNDEENEEPFTTPRKASRGDSVSSVLESIDGSVRQGGDEATSSPPSVTAPGTDHERQILLLMLLAQVCALHDPTPRTFTVHVLELFERGILDRDSIRFLFDLGLVPSLSPTRSSQPPLAIEAAAQTTPAASPNSNNNDNTPAASPLSEKDEVIPFRRHTLTETLELHAHTKTNLNIRRSTLPTMVDAHHQVRAAEASAIRSHLERHERQDNPTTPGTTTTTPLQHRTTTAEHHHVTTTTTTKTTSWAVEHHPLSLSRYQREFVEKRLLNAGSFGQVYEATSKMDGHAYAIKKVSFVSRGYSNDSVTQVVREVRCLAQCDHTHCVRYYTSWLEPSWMTGSSSSSNCGTSQQAQQQERKLLTDIQHMVNGDSGTSSQQQQKSSARSHKRRFSFGCSYRDDDYYTSDDDDDSDYSDWTVDMSYNNARGKYWMSGSRDDSFLDMKPNSRRGRTDEWDHHPRQPPKQQQPPSSTAYKYQISLFIQMQLCSPSTLADWIRQRNILHSPSSSNHGATHNHRDDAGPALKVFHQIVSGIAHVHTKDIIHRDLKPANIFASTDDFGTFKIGDFGLSKLLRCANGGKDFVVDHDDDHQPTTPRKKSPRHSPPLLLTSAAATLKNVSPTKHKKDKHGIFWQDPLTAGVGTASYAAPEQIASGTYGSEADIFSLGLILLELMCGFDTEHERIHTFHACRHERKLPVCLKECYPKIALLILACTDPKPDKRPTAKELLLASSSDLSQKEDPHETTMAPDSNNKAAPAALDLHGQHRVEVESLQGQLKAKEEELQKHRSTIAEKDRIIEDLLRQMENNSMAIKNDDGDDHPFTYGGTGTSLAEQHAASISPLPNLGGEESTTSFSDDDDY